MDNTATSVIAHHKPKQKNLMRRSRFPLQIISSGLVPNDKLEFDSIFEEKQNDRKKVMKVVIVSFVISFIITTLFGAIKVFGKFTVPSPIIIILVMVGMFYGLGYFFYSIKKDRPFYDTFSRSWNSFLVSKGIFASNHKTLYQFARSYIKKTNPEASHYILSLFKKEYLAKLEEPSSRKEKQENFRVLALLTLDWRMFESLSTPKKSRRQKAMIVNSIVLITSVGFLLFNYLIPRLNDTSGQVDYLRIILIMIQGILVFLQYFSLVLKSTKFYKNEHVRELLLNNYISPPPGMLFLELIHFTEEKFPYIEI